MSINKLSRDTLALYFGYKNDLKDYDNYVLKRESGVLYRALEELREGVYRDVEGHEHETEIEVRETLGAIFYEWFDVYLMLDELYLPFIESNYAFTEADYERIFADGIFGNDVEGAAEHLRKLGAALDIP